jgi:hypothetical protein
MINLETDLRTVIDSIKQIDEENGTDLTTYVRHCVQTLSPTESLSKTEYQELLNDKLKLCELDSLLHDEKTIQLAQTLFNQVASLVVSSIFK